MYVNIHRPVRPFNEEFVDFWEASYEARLDDYALDILGPAIDHHFHPSLDSVSIANHYYTTASRYHKTVFVLSRDGKLIREELEETSLNAQFDEYARSALCEAALTLPPLPSGSARDTDFMLKASPDRIEVQPTILKDPWISDFYKYLKLTFKEGIKEWFRKNNPRKTPSIVDFSSFSYLLYFSNKEPHLRTHRPHPFTDDSLLDFMAAFLFRLELPAQFPNEMRFIVGGDYFHWYQRHLRGPLPRNRTDKCSEARRRQLRRETGKAALEKVLPLWRQNPKNKTLADSVLREAVGSENLELGLQICEEFIRNEPTNEFGYRSRLHVLWWYARYTDRYLEFAEEIVEACEEFISRFPKNNHLAELWVDVASNLIYLGKYDEAVAAANNCNGKWPVHERMACSLERMADWPNAIKEWNQHLQSQTDRDEDSDRPLNERIANCQALVDIANGASSLDDAILKTIKRFGLTRDEAEYALRLFSFPGDSPVSSTASSR